MPSQPYTIPAGCRHGRCGPRMRRSLAGLAAVRERCRPGRRCVLC